MNKIQLITLFVGSTSILAHLIGLYLHIESLNFLAAFLGRVSASLYLSALDKFKVYSLAPIALSIANVYYGDRLYLYLELASQSFIYQIIAFKTFKLINKND